MTWYQSTPSYSLLSWSKTNTVPLTTLPRRAHESTREKFGVSAVKVTDSTDTKVQVENSEGENETLSILHTRIKPLITV